MDSQISSESFLSIPVPPQNISLKKLEFIVCELWGSQREFGLGKIEFYNENDMLMDSKNYRFSTNNRIFDNTLDTFDENLKLGIPVFFSL